MGSVRSSGASGLGAGAGNRAEPMTDATVRRLVNPADTAAVARTA
ncbi:hypothetical protein [Nocardia terpenica]